MTPKALSREIKFRVYNTDWKMMVLPEDIYYIKFQGEKCEATDVAFNITTTDGMRNNNIWEDTEDIVFMQYTGLHDKKGKEIFTGDILQGVGGLKFQVFDGKGGFSINTFQDELTSGYTSVNALADLQTLGYIEGNTEVIGNIYESPELLTKENK